LIGDPGSGLLAAMPVAHDGWRPPVCAASVDRLLRALPGAGQGAQGGPAEIEIARIAGRALAAAAAEQGLSLIQRRPLAGQGTLCTLAAPGPRIVRILERAAGPHPATPGALVLLVGPDGCGKSSLARRLVEAWRPILGAAETFHLRPRLEPTTRRTFTVAADPHGTAPRGALMSIAKLGFLLGDYVLGYPAAVRPILRKGGLALFDRYAFDLVADPVRFRYGGPMRLARWLTRLVPQPDLSLLLDAPAELLHARKPELPLATIEALRQAYRRTLGARAIVLDASREPEALDREVERLLIAHLQRHCLAALARDGGG
jgi:thymidylate kinase